MKFAKFYNHDSIIKVKEGIKVKDKQGISHTIAIGIGDKIIADVYIFFNEEEPIPDTMEICDDSVLIANIFKFFKTLDYHGPSFDRAELGMQGKSYIVLEPNKQFEKFAKEKYGFKK